jgi:hypothetical protein
MPPDGSRPTGSSGARWRDPPQGRPTPTGSFGSSGDRSLHHRDRISVDRPGVHGFDPGSDYYRGSVRLVRSASAEASSTHPLQDQAHGSIGAGPLATATLLTDSAAEQGLEAGSRQRSRRRGSQPRRRPAQRPATARRYRPSVTTGRLLTRGTLRRVGHDRGRTCTRSSRPPDSCGPGAERHPDGSRERGQAAGAETA